MPALAEFRSGYASIVGKPNVGKSTLLNTLLGQKVSIVTSKPQTTRNRIIGIKTTEEAQVIFIDTPGIHRPRHRLGELMVKRAREALSGVDIILLMVEPSRPEPADLAIIRLLKGRTPVRGGGTAASKTPVFLLINKIDTVAKAKLLPVIDEYSGLYPFGEIIPVSALKGDGMDILLRAVTDRLPEGPKYYPEDLATDQLERFMVSEIIREKVMEATEEEVPHAAAVEVIEWTERPDGLVSIGANIYVERKGQKGIIIGKQGMRLKSIGTAARRDIESLLNTKVYLELWVKVKAEWRRREANLIELGFK